MISKPPVNQPATCRLNYPEPYPQGVRNTDAEAGNPVSTCQTPATAGVKPHNTNSHDHGCDY